MQAALTGSTEANYASKILTILESNYYFRDVAGATQTCPVFYHVVEIRTFLLQIERKTSGKQL